MKKKKCRHTRRGYWNALPGFKCLVCGEEVKEMFTGTNEALDKLTIIK